MKIISKNTYIMKIRYSYLLLVMLPFVSGAYITFDSAKWIGPSGEDIPFYPDYLPVFRIDFDIAVAADGRGSIVFGLNDPRLMNPDLNIYNLNNVPDSSAIKVELVGDGNVDVYRYGYHPDDGAKPIASFKCEVTPGANHITLTNNLGHL